LQCETIDCYHEVDSSQKHGNVRIKRSVHMMNKKCGLYLFAGVLLSLNAISKADPLDFLRPEDRREDYNEGTEQSGLLHQTYTDESGRRHRRFAPVESIFGSTREEGSRDDYYDDEDDEKPRRDRR
jgi:hypothetical protein